MPTCYSVIFSTPITIRPSACGFSGNCSSLEGGRLGGPQPTDRDAIDIHQLFADLVGKVRQDGQLTLRVGRQQMSYGWERLIAGREGPDDQNVSRRAVLGGYATVPCSSLPGMRLDLYYLGLINPHAVFNQVAGHEEAHTVGTCFFGPPRSLGCQ